MSKLESSQILDSMMGYVCTKKFKLILGNLIIHVTLLLYIQAQFSNSEKINEELRREVGSLMQQLSSHCEQTKVVKENETRVREEKRKVEQQLLVASADRVSEIELFDKTIAVY